MLLLDFTELLLDFALELDFAELLEATLDDERTLLLDFGVTLEEDFALDEEFDFTELLLASSQSSQTLDEESSPGRTKLLSSSSQAASAKAMANAATAPTNLLNGVFLMIDILFVPSIQKNSNNFEQIPPCLCIPGVVTLTFGDFRGQSPLGGVVASPHL